MTFVFFFKLRERERGWYIKFGYKGEIAQNYLSYFSTGFHWRIFLLSRANRLYCCFFFTLAWRTWGPSCLRYSFVFNPEYWLWFVCPLRTLLKNWLSYYLLPLRGRSPHFRFGVPANHLASLFSLLVSGDLRLLSTNTCWYPLCDLHSLLTVTFLTGRHCSFQREDSINLISIVSVGYHVTD